MKHIAQSSYFYTAFTAANDNHYLSLVVHRPTQRNSLNASSLIARPQTVVDSNGVTHTITYDSRQRVATSTITVGGVVQTTTNTWNLNDELAKMTLPDGTFIQHDYAWETASNPLTTSDTDAAGNKAQSTFNTANEVTAVKTLDSASNTYLWRNKTYDALGRVLTETNFDGSKVTTYTYDKNDNLLTVKDGNNHTTTYAYDVFDRRHTVTDANTGLTTINYNLLDQVTSVVAPGTITTSFTPDAFGDVMTLASPDTGTTTYAYNKNGLLTSKTDGASIVKNLTYDVLNRLATIAYPASSAENVTLTYDETGHGKGIGRLTTVTDSAGSLSLSYDERGKLTARNRTSGSGNMNIAYTYNSAGRLASLTYPSGLAIAYTRDTAGNIATVTATPSGGSATTIASYSSGYLPFGPAKAVALGNGVTTSYGYDHDLNMTTLTDNSSLQNLTYAYDNANNVSSVTDALAAANTQTYGYDVLDRLTSAVSGTGGYGTLGYTYNANGNRLTAVVNGTTTNYTTTANKNRITAIGSQAVSYNGNGNISTMITGATTDYGFTYNNANRLATTTTPTGGTTTNTYDGFGARFKKVNGANTTLYVTGAGNQMLEEKTGSAATDYIYVNGMPIATANGSTINYLHTDSMGTPQKATNGSKVVQWSTTYKPYGETGTITGSLTQNVRLPGQLFDADSGLYKNGQRDYMPGLGMYPEADPIGLRGGLNLYRYANGRPTRLIDPWGLTVQFTDPDPVRNKTLQSIYNTVKSTPQGSFLANSLEYSPINYTITSVPDPDPNFGNAVFNPNDFSIHIDLDGIYVLNTESGAQCLKPAIQLAHEMGHAAFSDVGLGAHEDDNGDGSKMNNINLNENPIRKSLGEPLRTSYPLIVYIPPGQALR